jgi:hydroxyacylglutathione hydrolase
MPAKLFGTNCYVVAAGPDQDCLVVDPGFGMAEALGEMLARHRLRPAAVLLTHGHLDHVFSVTPICGEHRVAAYIHGDDAYRLADPISELSPDVRQAFLQQYGSQLTKEPDDVVRLVDGQRLRIAGLEVDVVHSPGHTEGSVMFRLPGGPDEVTGAPPDGFGCTVLAGDVLFAGSIGRTDLPGGDGAVMMRTLRERVLPLPDDALVLPGHGPATTIGQERARNPFLREAAG